MSRTEMRIPHRKPWKDPTRAGITSVVSTALWWAVVLATISMGSWTRDVVDPLSELLVTVLFLLPWVAVIAGIVAIRRSRPHPAVAPGDRRSRRGRWMGWAGVFGGMVIPFYLFAYWAEQGGL